MPLVSALQPGWFLDVLVVAVRVGHHGLELALIQKAWMTGQVMKRSGLPADGIPGLFDGSMSSFSTLLQVASANHLEVHLLLVLALSLECTTFVLRHAQVLERRPLRATWG